MIFCIKLNHWTVSAVSCSVAVGGRPCQSFCKLDTCHRNFAVNFGEFLSNWCLWEPFWMSWEKKNEKDTVFYMFFVYHVSSYETLPKQSGQDWVPGVNPQSSGLRHPIVVLMINCRHGLAGEKDMKTKKETLWGNKIPIGSMGRLYIYLPLVDFDGKCM